jgi:pimeloyl-ACP methyl ester carboxylesterase
VILALFGWLSLAVEMGPPPGRLVDIGDVARVLEARRAGLAKLLQASAKEEHPLGRLPVVVLTRGTDADDSLRSVHAALARLSTNSRHAVVAGAGHEIHLFEPAAVIQAVREVVDAAMQTTKTDRLRH